MRLWSEMERNCHLLGLIIFTITTLNSSIKGYASLNSNTPPCNSSNYGEVRLVGGRDKYEGRVEVCHDGGEWKTVCDSGWNREESKVVCRQLGYPNASNAIHVRRGCAGQGSGGILRVQWNCTGEEENLLNCSMVERNGTDLLVDCTSHKTDAGVYCSGLREDICELRSLRLVGGADSASGRVEVCRFGCWGTVCDEGWDRYDANVACRQLGFETERAIPVRGRYFGEGRADRPILLSQVSCEGSKDVPQLLNCAQSGINHQCLHNQDAGVICNGPSVCSDGEVRLADGKAEREGDLRVEMCYNGVWGTVCSDSWGESETNVVCRQLGYNNSPWAKGGQQNSPLIFNNISCNGLTSTLFECMDLMNIGVFDCEIKNYSAAGVICIEETSPDSTLIIVLGTVCGLLAIGAIAAISVASVIIVMVMVKRKQRKITFKKGSGVYNPTYDERQGTPPLSDQTTSNELEKQFANPIIYSDVMPCDSTNQLTLDPPASCEAVYSECGYAEVNNKTLESDTNHITSDTHIVQNGTESNDRMIMKGATSDPEKVNDHEQPLHLDDAGHSTGDENSYSTLDPSHYSQIQPHIGGPNSGVQFPPSDDDYSHLQHT